MPSVLVSLLAVATGVIAACVGMVVATMRLQAAHRAYARTVARRTLSPIGWDDWFLLGFSGVTMGTRGLSAVAAWLFWTLGGLGLIGLGIRVFHRV